MMGNKNCVTQCLRNMPSDDETWALHYFDVSLTTLHTVIHILFTVGHWFFFRLLRVSITSSTVTLFLPFLPWVSCSFCLFLYRFLPPLPLLLSLLCLPLSFLCELDSWDAVSADRWSSGETGRLECQAASMLKDGGRKKNTFQSTFPLEVFVRSSDFLERHSF